MKGPSMPVGVPKGLFLTIMALGFCLTMMGQNIVPNPDFETFSGCPTGFGDGDLECTPWQVPTLGTADYFHTCAGGTVGVPNNFFGNQVPHSGEAYVGMYAWGELIPEYREYVQVELTEPMVAGNTYVVSVYYSLADLACPVDKIGIHISDVEISEPGSTGPIDVQPQIEATGGLLDNPDSWELLTGCYVAVGGEQWIIIGNFYSAAELEIGTGCPLLGGSIVSYYYYDDVTVEEGPPPGDLDFTLGPNVTECGSYEIVVPVDNASYLWQDGSHGQTFTATETGVYYVNVAQDCNFGTDTIMVTILPDVPPVELGDPEIMICPGESIQYNFDPDLGDYLWQDNSTSPDYVIDGPGIYSVTLTNDCGSSEDVITVDILNPPIDFSLGPDTTLCPLGLVTLSVDTGLGEYLWQDGSTGNSIEVSQAGEYALTISNMCGAAIDTIVINYYPEPAVSFQADTVFLCDGEEVEFNFDPDIGEYVWQDGEIGPDYTVSGPGQYGVTVTNFCGSDFASVVVDYDYEPLLDLGPDITICPQQLPYTINLTGLPDVEAFQWDDGTTDPVYLVSEEGLFGVTVSNDCFEVWDDIIVIVDDAPPVVELPGDTMLCEGGVLVLDVGDVPGTYVWQDGSQVDVYAISQSGTYSVTVSNACGEDSDEIDVLFSDGLPPLDLGPDINICPGDQVVLYAGVFGVEYLWQDGSTADSILVSGEETVILAVSNDCGVISDTLEVTENASAPMAALPDSVAICDGDSMIIQTIISGAMYQWNTGSVYQSIVVNAPGEYILTVTNTCGSDVDTTVVTSSGSAPAFDLGPDVTLCDGDTIVIDPGIQGDFLWHDGSADSGYSVMDSGLVALTVTNTCGFATDTLFAELLPSVPNVDLGPDTSICAGETIVFVPDIADVNYLWSDGSMAVAFSTGAPDTVTVEISNSCGISTDTVIIDVWPAIPDLDLGPDFSVCPGESVTLNPGLIDVSYLWNNGSTDDELAVPGPGEYSLTITNACGQSIDTIVISEDANGPALDLGPDIELCEGESIDISPGLNNVSYLWHDGSSGSTLSVSSTSTVILEVSNGCGSARDTLEVVVSGTAPGVSLGPDMMLCDGAEFTILLEDDGSEFIWQDGSITNTYQVQSAGTYSVTVSNECGEAIDSLTIATEESPAPFDLGEDETICAGDEFIISAPALLPGQELLWSTGSADTLLTVTSSGAFSLTLSNVCGMSSDTILVFVDNNQIVPPAVDEFRICEGEMVVLDAGQSFDADYLWSDGTSNETAVASVPGDYLVTITSNCDELVEDFLVEQGNCVNGNVFIPNIFSPNNDNINDVFSIDFDQTDLSDFAIWIYDRWGEIVFYSIDADFGWTGRFGGEDLLPGVYVYQILIERAGEPEQRVHGDVTLIR